MDAVFVEYERRFRSFRARNHKRFALYLFAKRQEYLDFLSDCGVNAEGTAGFFFVRPGIQGLAAWVEGQSQSQLYEILQHEGFHQFAYVYIGTNVPVWANEGLAEYFGHSILVNNKMIVGQADEFRIEFVKHAIREERTVDFGQLLEMTPQTWADVRRANPTDAALLYHQSWSMVFFLIHGEKGKYLGAFERYLSHLSRGIDSRTAFERAFGSGTSKPFEKRWKAFALAAKPAALNTTIARMEFLGEGLRFLQERGDSAPATMDQLCKRLQGIQFKRIRSQHGLMRELSALDKDVFTVLKPDGGTGRFQLLKPSAPDLPASLTAPGVKPQPTLRWSRDATGQLKDEMTFR